MKYKCKTTKLKENLELIEKRMRLTEELINHQRSLCHLNVLGDLEIDFCGFQIPLIENINILNDSYDTVNLNDNEIRELNNFPLMIRLKHLIMCNNYIDSIDISFGNNLLSLQSLILTNNRIESLNILYNLKNLKNLESITLLDNPVTVDKAYRFYLIYILPKLKFIDFQKVTNSEREMANNTFGSRNGEILSNLITNNNNDKDNKDNKLSEKKKYTDQQKKIIRNAIANAQSKEELDKIEEELEKGIFQF